MKPFSRKLIQSPFLAYEGNYELDVQAQQTIKSEKNSQNQQEIPNKSSFFFPKETTEEIKNFISQRNQILSAKAINLIKNFIENKIQNEELMETIFLMAYLIDGPKKRLFNYPNLQSFFLKNTGNLSILQYVSNSSLEFMKKQLLTNTISLRYFSRINLSLPQFLYIIYAVEVLSKPIKIEEALDRDLLITLINSLEYDVKKREIDITSKEALFLFRICNDYCFSDLEAKNQQFNAYVLDIIEKKSQIMVINELFYFAKEINKIPIEKTQFTQKERFFPIIESIQANLLQILKKENLMKNFEKSLLELPDFYYTFFILFSKIGVISIPLLSLLEDKFIKKKINSSFKSNLIAFNMLTNLGLGSNLLEFIKKNIKNGAFLHEIKAYPQYYLVKFLLKIIILEIVKIWDSIVLTKDPQTENTYFKKQDLLTAKANLHTFFDSNLETISILLTVIIENHKKEEFSKEMKANIVRILEFLNYSERMNKLMEINENKEKINDLIEELKGEEIEFYRNENNYYNQFNADIYSILNKNGFKFQAEKRFVYRYCDIYLPEYNIVLELDGKFHFYLNMPGEELVSNKCRDVFILMKEARLFEISIFQWEKYREKREMEKIFMEKLNFFIKNEDIVFIRY